MKKTKCQLHREMQKSGVEDIDDIDAYRFEVKGWFMSIELAPRCKDPNCEFCN